MKFNLAYTAIVLTLTMTTMMATAANNVTTTTAEIDEILEKEKEIMAVLSSLQAEEKQLDAATTTSPSSGPTVHQLTKREIHHQHVLDAKTGKATPTSEEESSSSSNTMSMMEGRASVVLAKAGKSSGYGEEVYTTMSMMEGMITTSTSTNTLGGEDGVVVVVASSKATKATKAEHVREGDHADKEAEMSLHHDKGSKVGKMGKTSSTTTHSMMYNTNDNTMTTTKAAKARDGEHVGGAAKTAKEMSIASKNDKEVHYDAKSSKTMSITTSTTTTVVVLGGKSSKLDEEHILSMYQSATDAILSMEYYAKSGKGTSEAAIPRTTGPTEPMDNIIFTEAPGVDDLDLGSVAEAEAGAIENEPRDSSSSLSKFEEEVKEAMISGSTAVISSPVQHHKGDLVDKPRANGSTVNALEMTSSGASSLVSSSSYAVLGICLVSSAIAYAIMV
jgi:hypothetical protein